MSINKNFENLHLNNFEFIENTDNYIENKVYDDLKLKVKKVFKNGKCSCNSNCFEKIGQLIAFQKDKEITKNKKYFHFNFCFNNNLLICHTTYLALIEVSHYYLDNIKKHLQKYSLQERIHGNTGNIPKNKNHIEVNYNLAYEIHEFLKNYTNIYALVYRDYAQAYKNKHE
ncbi:hypothetical protein C1645_769005, partial [Glomus cerebriforme]